MRILVDENIPQGPEVFSAHGEVTTFHGRALKRADLQGADVLMVRSITKVNADLLEGTPVKFVGTATIGVDHVDREYLRKQGIGFSAAPGCNARSVAEYFAAALLHLHVERGLKLEGKTLGVVGYGNVGKKVAAIAPALGLKVLLSDPPLADAGNPGIFLPLGELYRNSDIVTMHVPLTKSGSHPTLKMADRALFESVTEPKVLMNMGRGESMDEEGLLWALEAGRLRHLVLDVFPGEPDVNPKLAKRADLISPHIAGYSIQGKLNGTAQILEAFRAHFGFEKKSSVAMPLPPDPEIAYAETGSDLEADLATCVRRSYDIRRDDADLRGFLGDPEFPSRFDALRKHYPVRHEFAGFRVSGIPAEKSALRGRLQGLGFSVE